MKHKAAIIFSFLILIGAMVYVHAQSSSAMPAGGVGRYQIIAVNLTTADGPNDGTAMKVDTETGRTWTLIEYWDSNANGTRGAHHHGWVEVPPFPGEPNPYTH